MPKSDDHPATDIDLAEIFDFLEDRGRPVLTANEAAGRFDRSHADITDQLESLVETDDLGRYDASADPVVYFPADWKEITDRERTILFPGRREIIVHHPTQFTRAQLSEFAQLVETNRSGGYIYELRAEDIWRAPFSSLESLLETIRSVTGVTDHGLAEWIETQWDRAHAFRLTTHEDGYIVLEARTADLLGNVAEQHLESGHIRARLSDTTAWIAEEATAAVKRTLYEAGYPIQDERVLEAGADLDLSLAPDLRDYQQSWVTRFLDRGAGVLVGPPGSGKTVTALAIMASIGGETLILVPSRNLVDHWKTALLEQTSLRPEQIGEYHGGKKQLRPVTIATYQTAGMDRHRSLFEDRQWGLVIYEEVHHIPAPIHRRTADLQTRHRLGLSATPVRESDDEDQIFTLVGPPIGTDWGALFDAGYVAEPEIEIRYVPWGSTEAQNAYSSATGHQRRQLAASNPAKVDEIRNILATTSGKTLIFVEYLEQGETLAEALSFPFINGETPHDRRRRVFQRFRSGPLETLIVSRIADEGIDLPETEVAIAASGLGGSRRQGAQRAGRTMRPIGRARLFVLATRGTMEEEFARRRMRHLVEKGIRVTEIDPSE